MGFYMNLQLFINLQLKPLFLLIFVNRELAFVLD